jgi:anti-sigma regulatory factor (Ser/Thr protein kinase)
MAHPHGERHLVGTSEAVNNALLYGDPPATVRIWATSNRIVIHVHDNGPGPANPLAGLIPPASRAENAELGLWLTHQLDIDVALIYADGFTVRLRGGAITA